MWQLSIFIKRPKHPYAVIYKCSVRRNVLTKLLELFKNLFHDHNCDTRRDWKIKTIELLNNNSHGLSPPGGSVSPSGRFCVKLSKHLKRLNSFEVYLIWIRTNNLSLYVFLTQYRWDIQYLSHWVILDGKQKLLEC